MPDLIDRKKLIEDIKKSWFKDTHVTNEGSKVHNQEHRHLLSIIENQPKIGNWIPVTERLPENNTPCLFSAKNEHFEAVYCGVYMFDEFTWLEGNCPTLLPEEFEVLAWMPLPEPYKEGDL